MSTESKNHLTGLVLSILMLLTLLNSGYFFLGILHLSIGKWLAFNACSLATIVYLICYISYRIYGYEFISAIPILPLYYYGTMGLFIMPWDVDNLFAHISHIVITLTVIWLVYGFIKSKKFEQLGKGIIISVVLFVPIFAFIQIYVQNHINEFMQILKNVR